MHSCLEPAPNGRVISESAFEHDLFLHAMSNQISLFEAAGPNIPYAYSRASCNYNMYCPQINPTKYGYSTDFSSIVPKGIRTFSHQTKGLRFCEIRCHRKTTVYIIAIFEPWLPISRT